MNKNKILNTRRLTLRPRTEADAESLYKYAKDPEIGIPAGWPPHKSVEESLDVIKNVFTGKECYAILEKESNETIGAVIMMEIVSLKEHRRKWASSIIIPVMKFLFHY